MSVPFKSSPVEFNQHLLFPTNIFDLLPKDHECFLYADLFQQLDTSSLESLYSVNGRNAYPTSAHLLSNNLEASVGTLEIIPAQTALTVLFFGANRIVPVRITEFSITEEAFD